jgi:hypothetical protein
MSEPSFFYLNMKGTEMTQLKEAIEVAVNTQKELTLREQPESNRVLIKALGQILTSVQSHLRTIDADTTQ